MNALTAIRPAYDLDAAHKQAHEWVAIARPLIKAYLALDQIQSDVLCASHRAGAYASSIRCSATDLSEAMAELLKDIEGLRDAVLSDVGPRQPLGIAHFDHAAWDAHDDLCEQWDERIRDVLSVEAAIGREARS